MDGRQGFWSYVHDDDDDEGGRISELSRLLSKRVRLRTGSAFPIFLDRDSIGWGEDWEASIDEALLTTTFFVPIITPSYFLSEQCRREMIKFASAANALGLEELILPIYYATVPELEEPPGPGSEELIHLVKRFNWEDWREVALEDASSSVHRKAVNHLAEKLLARASAADAKPAQSVADRAASHRALPPAGGGPAGTDGLAATGVGEEEEDDEPDRLGVLAAGEEAMPRLTQRLERVTPLIEAMGEYAEEATTAMSVSDARGKGFAGRLAASRALAKKLEGPATELEIAISGYLEDLFSVDKTVLLLFEILRESPDQIGDSAEFLDSIDELADAAESGLTSSETLAGIIGDNAKWSKDLRKPSRRIERALRQLADTRAIYRTWKAETQDLRAKHPQVAHPEGDR